MRLIICGSAPHNRSPVPPVLPTPAAYCCNSNLFADNGLVWLRDRYTGGVTDHTVNQPNEPR